MKKHKTLIILGAGALALWVFYRYRKGQPLIPSFGSSLAGQGTAGSTTSNGAFSSSSPLLPPVPVQSMTETERLRLRNLATGPLSRGQCLIGNGCRWIDTQTAPYFGLGVSQANFTRWLNSGYTSDSQPTLDYVKRYLGL